MKGWRAPAGAAVLALWGSCLSAQEEVDVHRLPLGHPVYRYDLRLLEEGGIYGREEDRAVGFDEMVAALARYRVVLLGEEHTNLEHHRLQARVVEALAALGDPLVVGMEFFLPAADQVLADYVGERTGLEAMLARSGWAATGGFNYRYYQPILEAARRTGTALVGINVPRDVVRTVSRWGLDALPPEARTLFPPVDVTHPEHRFLLLCLFGRSAVADPGFFARFYAAQCVWDTAMAANTLAALDRLGPRSRAAVVAGAGHVQYDLCIGRRIRELRPDVAVASVVMVAVPDAKPAPDLMAAMRGRARPGGAASRPAPSGPHGAASAPKGKVVARSLGLYVAGTAPAAGRGGDFPGPPFRIVQQGDGLALAGILPGGAAAQAGLKDGDRLERIDGRAFATPDEALIHLMGRDWGDNLVVAVRTDLGVVERRLHLARPAPPSPAPPAGRDRPRPASGPAVRPPAPATRPASSPHPHHWILVTLRPETGGLEATDRLRLPRELLGRRQGRIVFALAAGLEPSLVGGEAPGAVLAPAGGEGPVRRWELRLPPPYPADRVVALAVAGRIQRPPAPAGEDHARGFAETSGTIGPEGVFLTGESLWVPRLEGAPFVTFELEARAPAGWELVSQGRRTSRQSGAGGVAVRYAEAAPQEEIFLAGGPLTAYDGNAGGVATAVLLRGPDPALAGRYLAATAAYLEMYSRHLGAYPWPKFVTVENFWETGYGMPSFTLLGPQVLRFPWILTSSFPHEILHNWWGNGVYVDLEGGNWCEGLTAYLADHLLKEQEGLGAEHRQNALERYTDYAAEPGRDFALTAFRSRHSPATEAVGYGKSMMVFHMLRRRVGDQAFLDALRAFYAGRRHRRAGWGDLKSFFETGSGLDLGPFFRQWVERAGAPRLAAAGAEFKRTESGFELVFRLRQEQEGEPYRLNVPCAIHLAGEAEAKLLDVALEAGEVEVRRLLPARPVRVELDPRCDLFRRLLPGEVPPVLSRVLGAGRVLVVLPSAAPPAERAGLEAVAQALGGGRGGAVAVVEDTDPSLATGPPADRTFWILGAGNRLVPAVAELLARAGGGLEGGVLRLGDGKVRRAGEESLVLALPHPANPVLAAGFVCLGPAEAGPAVARKLAHYGKYSYLAFTGPGAVNTDKGRWRWAGSPLSLPVAGPGVEGASSATSALPPERPLWPAPPELAALKPPAAAAGGRPQGAGR